MKRYEYEEKHELIGYDDLNIELEKGIEIIYENGIHKFYALNEFWSGINDLSTQEMVEIRKIMEN